jgi:hypothetical protein
MVLVHEKGSGKTSLPSRRWLCADTSAVFSLIVGKRYPPLGADVSGLPPRFFPYLKYFFLLVHKKVSGQGFPLMFSFDGSPRVNGGSGC